MTESPRKGTKAVGERIWHGGCLKGWGTGWESDSVALKGERRVSAGPNPTWLAENLTDHHQRRVTEDPGCFEDLMNITGRPMTESEYDLRSSDAVDNSWAEYEGRHRDPVTGRLLETRAYFVDDQLVVAITDGFRRHFISCFHEHFDGPHAGVMATASVGARRIRYLRHLQFDIDSRQFVLGRRVRGV